MIQNFELYLILNPELSSDEVNNQLKNIEDTLTSELQVSDLQIDSQGLRKFAYPIKHHTTGFYALLTFNTDGKLLNMKNVERKLNINENVMRYLVINQTEFLKQKSKEKEVKVEITNHRELNKGKADKKCIVKYMGIRAIDYKDVEFLNQFTSPYAKIFARSKTGTSSKYQRKVNQAIKRARHMALMPFTPKYSK
jgi:small subunit ribosomal protein S18